MRKITPNNDRHGCYVDWEHERIEDLLHDAHQRNECLKGCLWCEAELQEVDPPQ